MDKRMLRSRTRLKECFISLINKKAFNEITVTELCQQAGLNRSTFYAHYDDIYDLHESIQKELYDEFDETLRTYLSEDTLWLSSLFNPDTEEKIPVLKEILIFIERNQDIFRHFFTVGNDLNFLDRFFDKGREHYWDSIRESLLDYDATIINYYYTFVANGTVGLIKDWVIGGFREEPDELEHLVHRFITQGFTPQKK